MLSAQNQLLFSEISRYNRWLARSRLKFLKILKVPIFVY